ncbi:MAG: ferritin [Anaerolineae bacterium]|nr:ferritin [Anaerolineae bacterium]
MLNPKVQDALNAQINMELSAFYTYLSMSAYFTSENLLGIAAWMRHHADEEMVHAMKIYDFIHQRRGQVRLTALDGPKTSWSSAVEAVEDALHHEEKVTASIDRLVDLARQERDHASDSFLQWFVDEQVEEEAVVDEILQQLKRVADFPAGLFMLDRDLAAHGGEEEEAEAAE